MPSSVAHDVAPIYIFIQHSWIMRPPYTIIDCDFTQSSPRSIAELEQIMVPAAGVLPDVLDDLLSLSHVIPFGVYMGHVGLARVLASITTVLIGSTGAPYLYL